MIRSRTLRALVCDDDAVLRSVLAGLLSDCGYRVVGEADTVDRALDILESSPVDLAIVDLALGAGSGEDLLDRTAREFPELRTVVFSAYTDRHDELLETGATAVFSKPDFGPLEDWLLEQVQIAPPEKEEEPALIDRRRPAHPAPELPAPPFRSVSWIEPWSSFADCVDRIWPGDAVLALDVLERDDVVRYGDPALLADQRLAMASLLGRAIRPTDRLAVAPQGPIVALVVAGHPEAPSAVFGRLEAAWDNAGNPGTPIGAFAHVRAGDMPAVTLGRVLRRLREPGTSAARPLRLA